MYFISRYSSVIDPYVPPEVFFESLCHMHPNGWSWPLEGEMSRIFKGSTGVSCSCLVANAATLKDVTKMVCTMSCVW